MKICVIRYSGSFDIEEFHEVTIPYGGEKGHYVQFSSLTGFGRRELARFTKANNRGHRLDFQYEVSVHLDVEVLLKPTLATMPRQTHDSAWAFYEAIGYDHRRNRFEVKTCSKS